MKSTVVHVIGGLEFGGAENLLLNVSSESPAFIHKIFSLGPEDEHALRFRSKGRYVRTFGLRDNASRRSPRRLLQAVSGIFRLVLEMRRESPDIIQTWMYHSDLVGGVLAKLLRKPVIWGIFNSNLEQKNYRWRTNRIIALCGLLAKRIPDRITSCSATGAERHCEIGYPRNKVVLIPTGVDTSRFSRTDNQKATLREAFGVRQKAKVIGMVARWDPQKDFQALLSSVRQVSARIENTELWLAGGYGIDESNDDLMAMIRQYGLTDSVKTFGALSERLVDFYSCLDVFVLASKGEGVPNVLLEAMSMGLPCVASNVGDVELVLGGAESTVPPGNDYLLAERIQQLLTCSQKERDEIGAKMRERAIKNHSHPETISSVETVYRDVVSK